jgi:hypothetical protein
MRPMERVGALEWWCSVVWRHHDVAEEQPHLPPASAFCVPSFSTAGMKATCSPNYTALQPSNCTLVLSFCLDPQTEGCDPQEVTRFAKSYLECIYVVSLLFNEILAENVSALGKALRFPSWVEEEHFIAYRMSSWAWYRPGTVRRTWTALSLTGVDGDSLKFMYYFGDNGITNF